MSSASWTCEEDIWEDLRLMSTPSAAGAAARASSELAKLHAPIRMPHSESFGLVRTTVPSPTPQELDPWSSSKSTGGISLDEELRVPQGVRTDTEKLKIPKGRGARFANIDETEDFNTNLEKLQSEMQQCGVTKDYSNITIKKNYEKRLAEKKCKPAVTVVTIDSDSEDKTVDSSELDSSSSTSSASSVIHVPKVKTNNSEILGEFKLNRKDFPKL